MIDIDIEKYFCETIWRFFQSIKFKPKYDELFIKTNFNLAFDDYVYNNDWDGYRMIRIFELYNGRYCTVEIRNGRYEIIELEKRPVMHYVYEIKEKPLLN